MVITRMTQRKPCFFKPVLPGSFQEIAIPNAFLKHLIGENGEEGEAILKSHSHCGKSWRVKVKGFRFQEGWREFARDHDLVVGDFMVFRHEGGLVFETMLFNPNACEKVYPTFDIEKEDKSPEKDERRGNKTLVVENINGQKAAKSYATSSQTKHTSFVVLLRRFNVKYSIMIIPNDFARSNGLSGKNGKAVLRDPKGRTWPVNLIFSKADGRISIGCGWRVFATSNCLKEDDVCIFKLICSRKIHKGGIHLDVMVLDADMCGRQYRQACQTEPMHPFFVIHLEKHNLNKSVLNIPKSFATFCGLKGKISEAVLKDQKGRAWPVKLKSRLYYGVDIVAGWLEFSAANHLKEEDICIFRLISSGKMHDDALVFDVTVLDNDMDDQPGKPCR